MAIVVDGRAGPPGLRRSTETAPASTIGRPVRRGPRLVAVAIVGVAAIGSAGCQPVLRTARTTRAAPPLVSTQGAVTLATITPDGQDRYLATSTTSTLTVAAPSSNTGGNLRTVITGAGAPVSVDQQSCVSFGAPTSTWAQPGVSLRVRTDGGRVRAIFVSNNVVFGARGVFNVHVADTGVDPPIRQLAGMTFPDTIGSEPVPAAPRPWRLCARAVGGSVEVKAWSPTKTPVEPAWGDPGATEVVALPAGWVYAGAAGAYSGHLAPGTAQPLSAVEAVAVTGTPGSAYWDAALAWSDKASAALGSAPATDATRVAQAQQLTFDAAPAVAGRIAASPSGRHAEAVLVHQAIHGTRSRPPAGAVAPQLGVDGYLAAQVAAIGGGSLTDDEWATRAHVATLRRGPTTTEAEQVRARLGAGVGRRTVALELVRSQEHARLQAADAVLAAFGRPATAEEITDAAARYAALGADGIRLRAELVATLAPAR